MAKELDTTNNKQKGVFEPYAEIKNSKPLDLHIQMSCYKNFLQRKYE